MVESKYKVLYDIRVAAQGNEFCQEDSKVYQFVKTEK